MRPVRRWTVRRLPRRPVTSTRETQAAAPHDRVLERFGCQAGEPGVEELVVGVDAESAVRPEAPGGAPVATAENNRQAGGNYHPGSGHGDTPVPVRRPQRKGARRTGATRDGFSARGVSLGVHCHVLARGDCGREHANRPREYRSTEFRARAATPPRRATVSGTHIGASVIAAGYDQAQPTTSQGPRRGNPGALTGHATGTVFGYS